MLESSEALHVHINMHMQYKDARFHCILTCTCNKKQETLDSKARHCIFTCTCHKRACKRIRGPTKQTPKFDLQQNYGSGKSSSGGGGGLDDYGSGKRAVGVRGGGGGRTMDSKVGQGQISQGTHCCLYSTKLIGKQCAFLQVVWGRIADTCKHFYHAQNLKSPPELPRTPSPPNACGQLAPSLCETRRCAPSPPPPRATNNPGTKIQPINQSINPFQRGHPHQT